MTCTNSKISPEEPLQILATPGLFAKEQGETKGITMEAKDVDENGSLDDLSDDGDVLVDFIEDEAGTLALTRDLAASRSIGRQVISIIIWIC